MSTRAIYIFKDKDEQYTVYKHHDGYPKGAVQWLTIAQRLSWTGARFEPDEAAASLVAAAKLCGHLHISANGKLALGDSINTHPLGGGVRLMNVSKKKGIFDGAPCDIQFAYVIESKTGDWHVTAYATDFWDGAVKENAKEIWRGPLEEMAEWANSYED